MTSSPTANSKPGRRWRPRGRRIPGRAACRRAIGCRVRRKHAHGEHQVHEVEAGGGNLDLDLVRAVRPARETDRVHRVEDARPRHLDLEALRGVFHRAAHGMHRGRRYRQQPAHIAQLAVQRDLVLGVGRGVEPRPGTRFLLAQVARSTRRQRRLGCSLIATRPNPHSGDCAMRSVSARLSSGCAACVTSQTLSTATLSDAASAWMSCITETQPSRADDTSASSSCRSVASASRLQK